MKPYSSKSREFTTTLSLKLRKDSSLHEAMGEVDELIALINVALLNLKGSEKTSKTSASTSPEEELKRSVDNLKLILEGLAMTSYAEDDISPKFRGRLKEIATQLGKEEKRLESLNQELWGNRTLKEFKYLFEERDSAFLNLIRTVVRRVERKLITASKEFFIPDELKGYLNRLSDTLFILSIIMEERDEG